MERSEAEQMRRGHRPKPLGPLDSAKRLPGFTHRARVLDVAKNMNELETIIDAGRRMVRSRIRACQGDCRTREGATSLAETVERRADLARVSAIGRVSLVTFNVWEVR